jgi:histidinol-phosphate phosphatase family protein
MARRRTEHLFVETDGQVYLVKDRGRWRFPRVDERLPFRYEIAATMDFGADVVRRAKPKLSYHPEEWFQRDDLFARSDVDGLVTRAVYMTMTRLVAEVVFVKDGRIMMEKAARGFSKGHWNLPGGFLDYGERPEEGARRECEEELGVPVRIDRPLGTYLSGFPGKPAFTVGFVYRGTLGSERFRLKRDEIERVDWLPAWRGLEATRNPFAKWALVDAYRQGFVPEIEVRTHRPRASARSSGGPVVFVDRDGTINRDPGDCVRTPAQFSFLPGAKAAMKALRAAGYRLAVVSNQDAVAWGLITERALRRVHAKMVRELAAAGAAVENVYYCPHEEGDGCACRKPHAGMLMAACRDLDASPGDAWIVGNSPGDVLAGKAIGAMTALVGDAQTRGSSEDLRDARPDVTVDSLAAFAKAVREGTLPTATRPAYT